MSGGSQGTRCFTPDVTNSSDWPDGEILRVQDLASDGMRVGVHWWTSTSDGMCIDSHGAGVSEAGYYCDIPNVAEGSYVNYKMMRCNASTTGCNELTDWQKDACYRHFYDDADTVNEKENETGGPYVC